MLKVYPLFRSLGLESPGGDTAILPQEHYLKFLYSWMHFSPSLDVAPMVRHLFRGILVLLQNQLLLALVSTLDEKEQERRRYDRPVALYQKPKIK